MGVALIEGGNWEFSRPSFECKKMKNAPAFCSDCALGQAHDFLSFQPGRIICLKLNFRSRS